MSDLLFAYGHPSRVPQAPVVLAPPLAEVWSEWYPHPVAQLPLVSQGVVVYRRRLTVHARLESNGRKRWSVKGTDSDPGCIWKGDVVAWEPGAAIMLRVETGEQTGILAGSPVARCLVSGPLLIGSMVDVIRAYDLSSRTQAWEWWRDPETFGPQNDANLVAMTACADDARLYFGMRDGTVRALSLKDGKEAWRSTPFPKHRHYLADVQGVAYCRDGLVFVRTEAHVGAFDCRTGRRRWMRELEPMLTDGCVYGDRYYALQSRGAYWILDLKTGRDAFHADLRAEVPEKFWDRNDTFNPMAVSETHVFCGLGVGYFLAFERDTGRLVWHHYPKPHASFHPWSTFQIVNGRLYTGDLSFLRVFGPAAERKPSRSRKAAKTHRTKAR